jgi:hypothetical protein
VLGQVVEQVELAPAQLEPGAVQGGLVCVRVQPQAADLERAGRTRAGAGRPAQHGADPGVDLARAERLDHVVVSPRVEHPDDLGLIVARGDHHDRDGCDGPHHPQGLVPAEIGQPEVEQDQVRRRV